MRRGLIFVTVLSFSLAFGIIARGATNDVGSNGDKLKLEFYYIDENEICPSPGAFKNCDALESLQADRFYTRLENDADEKVTVMLSSRIERASDEYVNLFESIEAYPNVREVLPKAVVFVFWVNNTTDTCRLILHSEMKGDDIEKTRQCPGKRYFHWVDAYDLSIRNDPRIEMHVGPEYYALTFR